MVQYAPAEIPLIVDMVDVDSEKFVEYSKRRRPGFLYEIEANRLRAIETSASARSKAVLLTTEAERQLFRSRVGDGNVRVMENGIDPEFFHPAADIPGCEMAGRDYAVFTGVMNYPPNAEAACWFARQALPEIRRLRPHFQFLIVGRSPSADVRALREIPGVVVTGTVADVRPYLRHASVSVAPLFLARGIQNKVLEALAMGKPVLASPAVMKTFGSNVPIGLRCCKTPAEYARELSRGLRQAGTSIRADVTARFRWREKLSVVDDELAQIFAAPAAGIR
jgi:sugar transferase (PEP-CTERM/EpsH1 system associated)